MCLAGEYIIIIIITHGREACRGVALLSFRFVFRCQFGHHMTRAMIRVRHVRRFESCLRGLT